jgi:hypothetical protein
MRLIKGLVLLAIALTICFGLGTFFFREGVEVLQSGALTYTRKGHPTVTVTADNHAFSFYYQVLFFLAMGASLLLVGASFVLYAIAKLARLPRFSAERFASSTYNIATVVACAGLTLGVVWVLLRMFRYWLIQ